MIRSNVNSMNSDLVNLHSTKRSFIFVLEEKSLDKTLFIFWQDRRAEEDLKFIEAYLKKLGKDQVKN